MENITNKQLGVAALGVFTAAVALSFAKKENKKEQTVEEFAEELEAEIMPLLKFYPDFPKKGVNFLDVFSITEQPEVFHKIMEGLRRLVKEKFGEPGKDFTHLVGLESKGFVLGPVLALEYNIPFVPIRKKGKLPGECWTQDYNLEYGSDTIQIHKHALPAGSKALMVDDLLATGGTLAAGEALIRNIPDVKCIGSFIIFEIDCLKGRKKTAERVETLIHLKFEE